MSLLPVTTIVGHVDFDGLEVRSGVCRPGAGSSSGEQVTVAFRSLASGRTGDGDDQRAILGRLSEPNSGAGRASWGSQFRSPLTENQPGPSEPVGDPSH